MLFIITLIFMIVCNIAFYRFKAEKLEPEGVFSIMTIALVIYTISIIGMYKG